MRAYELMVILSPEVEDRAVEPSLSKFLEIVTSEGGSIDNVDIWGRRRLAYEISACLVGSEMCIRDRG